jgi:hypothetical protein
MQIFYIFCFENEIREDFETFYSTFYNFYYSSKTAISFKISAAIKPE